jgi:hypothetical protein
MLILMLVLVLVLVLMYSPGGHQAQGLHAAAL